MMQQNDNKEILGQIQKHMHPLVKTTCLMSTESQVILLEAITKPQRSSNTIFDASDATNREGWFLVSAFLEKRRL